MACATSLTTGREPHPGTRRVSNLKWGLLDEEEIPQATPQETPASPLRACPLTSCHGRHRARQLGPLAGIAGGVPEERRPGGGSPCTTRGIMPPKQRAEKLVPVESRTRIRSPRVPEKVVVEAALHPLIKHDTLAFGVVFCEALGAVHARTAANWEGLLWDPVTESPLEVFLQPSAGGWKLVVQG